MVDFNNDTTIGTPAVDIVRVLILQARANVYEALELYYKVKFSGVSARLNIVKARLITWFLEHQAYIKRIDEAKFKEIKKTLFNNSIDEATVLDLIFFFNELLDKLKITMIDTRKQYDRSKIEDENRAYNL